MNWNEGFTGSYYITIVDPSSWRDIGRMEITSGTVERSASDLLESADITVTELPEGGEAWIRIWLDADQNGVERIPLFTGLTSAPTSSHRFAMSFMKLMRVASIELAAYLIISAEGISVKISRSLIIMNGL